MPDSDEDYCGNRKDEKDDCAHYSECLTQAAKVEGRRGNRARENCIPCKDCPRYRPQDPEGESAWKQRGTNHWPLP